MKLPKTWTKGALNERTIEALETYLAELREQLAELECSEPNDEDFDEHDEWDDQMAELEALIFDVEDQLDELRG